MAPRRSARSRTNNTSAVIDVICVPEDTHTNTRATTGRKRKNNSGQTQNKRNASNRGRPTRTGPRPVVVSLDVTYSESSDNTDVTDSDVDEITIPSSPESDKVKKERLETNSSPLKDLGSCSPIKDNRCSLSDSDDDIVPDFCPRKPSQQNKNVDYSDSDSETDIYKVDYEAERWKAFENVENEMNEMAARSKKKRNLAKQNNILDFSLSNIDSPFKDLNNSIENDSLILDNLDGSPSLDISVDISSIVLKGQAKIVRRVNKKTKNALQSLQAFSKRVEKDSQQITNSKEDDLDDDDIIMAEDSTVAIKICWGTSYTRHRLNKNEKFSGLYQELANEHQVSVSKVVLSFKDSVVSPESSPRDINLSLGDMLDGGILRNTTTNSSSESTGKVEGEISLKVQTANRKVVHTVSMSKYDKMSVLMDKYSKLRDIPLDKLKFKFDGEILESSDTPSSLDLEGDECIDAFEL